MSGPLPPGPPPGLGYTPASGGSYGGPALGALSPIQAQARALAIYQLKSFQANSRPTPTLPREKPRVGELIGYRAWLVIANRLYSISMVGNEWAPGRVMSDKYNAGLEIADHNYVGIWAFSNPFDLESQFVSEPPIVFGTVWMWGTVIEHERGYRAQYAAVRSLDKAGPGIGIDLEALRALYLKRVRQCGTD